MSVGSTTSLALSALLQNRMRSALTMLGVVIGVAAVLMMESLGQGATSYIGETISGMGSNMLMVVPGSPRRRMGSPTSDAPLFTQADIDALRRGAHDVALLSPVASRTLRTVWGANNRNVTVNGVSPEYLDIRLWSVDQGRALSRDDERQGAQVCVVGHTVVSALFNGTPPLGEELRVHDVSCRVIGVLEAKGASAFGLDQDDVIYLPFSTALRGRARAQSRPAQPADGAALRMISRLAQVVLAHPEW